MIEIFIHLMVLDDFLKGKPVNVKVNYADQYDIKMLIDPRKYIITKSNSGSNVISIQKKKLFRRLRLKRKS